MADYDPKRAGRDSEGSGQRHMERWREGRGLSRREDFPFGSLHPSDLFTTSPFALMRRMMDDLDRSFGGFGEGRGGEQGLRALWSPAIEVREREGNLQVCAELPGMNQQDVKVEAADDRLIIQGERKRESQDEREGFHQSERQYGSFYRVIPLPEGAKVDQAKAQFSNGVLEITIPVPQPQPRNRQIPIEGGERKPQHAEGREAAKAAKAG